MIKSERRISREAVLATLGEWAKDLRFVRENRYGTGEHEEEKSVYIHLGENRSQKVAGIFITRTFRIAGTISGITGVQFTLDPEEWMGALRRFMPDTDVYDVYIFQTQKGDVEVRILSSQAAVQTVTGGVVPGDADKHAHLIDSERQAEALTSEILSNYLDKNPWIVTHPQFDSQAIRRSIVAHISAPARSEVRLSAGAPAAVPEEVRRVKSGYDMNAITRLQERLPIIDAAMLASAVAGKIAREGSAKDALMAQLIQLALAMDSTPEFLKEVKKILEIKDADGLAMEIVMAGDLDWAMGDENLPSLIAEFLNSQQRVVIPVVYKTGVEAKGASQAIAARSAALVEKLNGLGLDVKGRFELLPVSQKALMQKLGERANAQRVQMKVTGRSPVFVVSLPEKLMGLASDMLPGGRVIKESQKGSRNRTQFGAFRMAMAQFSQYLAAELKDKVVAMLDEKDNQQFKASVLEMIRTLWEKAQAQFQIAKSA